MLAWLDVSNSCIQDDKMEEVEEEDEQQAIVLHEDKQYYPSALQVYGQEVGGRCFYLIHSW